MKAQSKVVLVNGGSPELVRSVAKTLLDQEAIVALYHAEHPETSAMIVDELDSDDVFDVGALLGVFDEGSLPAKIVLNSCGRLDGVVNLWVPDANTTSESIDSYIKFLKDDIFVTGGLMVECGSQGMIVNQFMLPTLFADNPISTDIAAARGAVSAYTRAACVRFGKAGIRVNALFAGLIDLPETRAFANERVNAATPPIGRWIEASDIAETVAFLTLESGYMSGQGMVLDGGMTSGITGT